MSDLMFLTGAGFSCEAGVPLMVDFVKLFEKWLPNLTYDTDKELGRIYIQIKNAWGDNGFDLEKLYEVLVKINHPDLYPLPVELVPTIGTEGYPTWSRATELLEYELQKFVQKQCLVRHRSRVAYMEPIIDLAKKIGRINLVTLNYDTCVETLCEGRINLLDSFEDVVNGNTNIGFSLTEGILLTKLHGSVTWMRSADTGHPEYVMPSSIDMAGLDKGVASTFADKRMLIYPGIGKQISVTPYIQLFNEFWKFLQTSKICVVIGYQFADPHIRRNVLGGLRQNKGLHLVVVDPSADRIVRERLVTDNSVDVDLSRILAVNKGAGDAFGKGRLGDGILGWLERGFSAAEKNDTKRKLEMHFAERNSATESRSGRKLSQKLLFRYEGLRGIAKLPTGNEFVMTSKMGELVRYSMTTDSSEIIVKDLNLPVAVATQRDKVFILQNSYHFGNHLIDTPLAKDGIGRLLCLDITSGSMKAVTGVFSEIEFKKVVGLLTSSGLNTNAFWEAFPGLLRWPHSLVVLDDKRLLVAEARRVREVSLPKGDILANYDVPLGYNINTIAKLSDDEILILDKGVAFGNYGRLSMLYLSSGRCESLVGGWGQTAGMMVSEDNEYVVISKGGRFPNGTVVKLNLKKMLLDSKAKKLKGREAYEVHTWYGLNRPSQMVFKGKEILVTTLDGLVMLSAHK